jgi:hypothetical protein
LTVEDGELIDVAYEPSDNSGWRWTDFSAQHREIRGLHAAASSATRNGVFRLEGEDALTMARSMQMSKCLDPALGVYAAYGYSDLRRRELIRGMSSYMRQDLGGALFDVAMLARELDRKTTGGDPAVFGFAPLLAQGWALLSAYRIALPPSLEGLHRTLMPSVWTLFNSEGVGRVRKAMLTGEVR